MRASRTHVAVGLLCGLVLLALSPERAVADDAETKAAAAKAAEAKQPDTSTLPNEDLLKQANAILARGSGDYLAAVRALGGVEAQLDDVSKQLADLTPPQGEPKKDGDPKVKDTVNEAAAKAAVDAAKGKADFARQRLKLAQTREQLQVKVAAAVEGMQSTAGAFQTALEDLKPYAVEIALRFQDGTMTGARPAGLLPDALEKRRKELAAQQEKIKDRLSEARRSVEATAKSLDEAEKAVSAADAEATEAGKVYAREQRSPGPRTCSRPPRRWKPSSGFTPPRRRRSRC
jgi:hypothetical protein